MADLLKASYMSSSSQQLSQGEKSERQAVSKMLGNKIYRKKISSNQSFQQDNRLTPSHTNNNNNVNMTSMLSDDNSSQIEHSQLFEFSNNKALTPPKPIDKAITKNLDDQSISQISQHSRHRSASSSPSQKVSITQQQPIIPLVQAQVVKSRTHTPNRSSVHTHNGSQTDAQIQKLSPLLEISKTSNIIMILQIHLNNKIIKMAVREGDNSFSLTYKLLQSLNIQSTPNFIQKLSDILYEHIDHYLSALNSSVQTMNLGSISGHKWRSYMQVHRDFLNSIDINTSELQQRKIVEEPQIGILNVNLDGKSMGAIKIHRREEPIQAVQKFFFKNNLEINQIQFNKLVDEIYQIQLEYEIGLPSQRFRSKSPITSLVIEDFKLGKLEELKLNPDAILISATIILGRQRRFKFVAKRVCKIKMIIE